MGEEIKQTNEEVFLDGKKIGDVVEANIDDIKDGINSSDGTVNTEEQGAGKIPYDRFKEKVDEVNALKQQVADFEKAQEVAAKQELEDKEEYKTLYQQALNDIEAMKESSLNIKKESLLSKAGYNDEQIAKLSKLVEGESDEDINTSIESLKETFPTQPKYVDPSVDNAHRQKPETKDNHDLGRSLFDRIKRK